MTAAPEPTPTQALPALPTVAVPGYLDAVYWWAYVHPRAVRVFERPWLVNLILWGQYRRLGTLALDALSPDTGDALTGRTLQLACVYGDLTERLARRHAAGSALEVVDVLPVQLDNLRAKLPAELPVSVQLTRADCAALPMAEGSVDQALLFFLLHEMPEPVRRATLAEALRVLRPGGRLVVVDYHRPALLHPLHLPMLGVLRTLEPFALDLWRLPLQTWLPPSARILRHRTVFGGLYQMAEIDKS